MPAVNRVQRAGHPSRMRNLAKRAHHGAPAQRGFYPPHRVPYSKPFNHRKMPKFPPYNKPQKPSFAKYGAPHKGYSRPPKSSYDSYSKPATFGSFGPNSYQSKPYMATSYQHNSPQGASYSPQPSNKYPNPPPAYTAPFATSSQTSNTHSVKTSHLPSHSIAGSGSFGSVSSQPLGVAHSTVSTVHASAPSSHSSAPASYAAPSSLASYSSQSSSYNVGTGSHAQSASTTYGVPHPTHGAPQPPSYASFGSHFPKDQSDQATSYVHFYQGPEAPNDPLSPASSANTYSYSSTHYTENKHKGTVYDSDIGASETKVWGHQESKDKRVMKKAKEDGNFKAPKQTFGFQPYDSDSTRQSDKESGYNVGQGYFSDSVLSPNYYEQQSSSS